MAAALVILGAAACSNNSSGPTPATSTTTTAPTTVPVTTTVPATSTVPASQTLFTLTGTVSGADTSRGIRGAEVEILEGPGLGTKVTTNLVGVYAFPNLSGGNVHARVRADGYDSFDFRTPIVDRDVTFDVVMNKTVASTTTTIGPVTAAFGFSPNPCMMTTPAVACTVDGSLSSSAVGISIYTWTYLGITATGPSHNLQLSCGDGPEQTVNIPVTLTVTDTGGASAAVTHSVPVVKTHVCGFP